MNTDSISSHRQVRSQNLQQQPKRLGARCADQFLPARTWRLGFIAGTNQREDTEGDNTSVQNHCFILYNSQVIGECWYCHLPETGNLEFRPSGSSQRSQDVRHIAFQGKARSWPLSPDHMILSQGNEPWKFRACLFKTATLFSVVAKGLACQTQQLPEASELGTSSQGSSWKSWDARSKLFVPQGEAESWELPPNFMVLCREWDLW